MARPADPHARSALVAAARAEFVKQGIQRARIEDITHACGLSKGAFYLHFESKEALFRELVAQLQSEFDVVRVAREQAYARAVATTQRAPLDADFMAGLSALDAAEDRHLLTVMWQWRDVIDVLLRGCQGTEFDGVMWRILDVEVERVKQQCEAAKLVGLVRDDVQGEVIGMMVVGTYMLVARKLSQAREQPDFDALVGSLQQMLALGMLPPLSRAASPKPRRATSSNNRLMKKRISR